MKKYLVDYYDHTRTYYGTYHNHKEVSAWAGLALYVLFCGLLVRAVLPQSLIIEATVGITIIVLIIAIIAFRYIQNQLSMKDGAGALAAASKFLLAEIIQKQEDEIDVKKYMSIEESADTMAQSQYVLPKILLKKADVMNTRARGYQDRTKWLIYSLLFMSTLSLISVRWMMAIG